MKILFFNMTMLKGGAERTICNLCNSWKMEDDLYIVTCLGAEPQYVLDARVKVSGLISYEEYTKYGKIGTFLKISKKYNETVRNIKPDVIISFLPIPCMIAALNKWKHKAINIGSERSNPIYQYNIITKWLINRTYEKMDGVVFQTQWAKECFSKSVQRKSTVIGNPIEIKESFSINKRRNKDKIVSVGRFTPEKNYPLLIHAFNKVSKLKHEIKLYVYGKIDEKLEINELIKKLELENRVFLMGQVDNILEEIGDATMFVMSSLSEGMPNALMEAMAIGLPVISTDCPSGGPRELINDRYNGLLIENNNIEKLTDAIMELLDNETFSNKLGENARKIAVRYSIENVCNQWYAYINKLLEKR